MDASRHDLNLQRDLDIKSLQTECLDDYGREIFQRILDSFQPKTSALQRDAKEVARMQLLLILLDALLTGDFLPRSDEALEKMNQALNSDLSWIIGSAPVPELWFTRVDKIHENNQQSAISIQQDARQRRRQNGFGVIL